jgi:hypothetical protein
MFVVRLNGDPVIVLQSHAPFQEANFITWLFHDLCGHLIALLQTFHQLLHDKLTTSNDQNVVHMNKHKATVVSCFQNVRITIFSQTYLPLFANNAPNKLACNQLATRNKSLTAPTSHRPTR